LVNFSFHENTSISHWAQDALYSLGHADVFLAIPEETLVDVLKRFSKVTLSKEKVNVTAVKTLSKAGIARMAFTVELGSATQLQRILTVLADVAGVTHVGRG
jgi:GTP pyrophosphokinase